jgi:hypothetical protein
VPGATFVSVAGTKRIIGIRIAYQEGFEKAAALQIPPLRSSGAPVGMTRRVRRLSGRVATWMDRVANGYYAALQIHLRSFGAPVGMTREEGWLW